MPKSENGNRLMRSRETQFMRGARARGEATSHQDLVLSSDFRPVVPANARDELIQRARDQTGHD